MQKSYEFPTELPWRRYPTRIPNPKDEHISVRVTEEYHRKLDELREVLNIAPEISRSEVVRIIINRAWKDLVEEERIVVI